MAAEASWWRMTKVWQSYEPFFVTWQSDVEPLFVTCQSDVEPHVVASSWCVFRQDKLTNGCDECDILLTKRSQTLIAKILHYGKVALANVSLRKYRCLSIPTYLEYRCLLMLTNARELRNFFLTLSNHLKHSLFVGNWMPQPLWYLIRDDVNTRRSRSSCYTSEEDKKWKKALMTDCHPSITKPLLCFTMMPSIPQIVSKRKEDGPCQSFDVGTVLFVESRTKRERISPVVLLEWQRCIY